MKITKFVHACLLIQTDNGRKLLVDPGQFTWESGLFDLNTIDNLDAIIITHEHFDHFYEPFVEVIYQKFSQVQFVATPTVVRKLRSMGIDYATSESATDIEIFSTKTHASLDPLGKAPENIAVHLLDRLTVGGDRHDLEETKEILALTVTAPWGSMINAVRMAQQLKPKVILPIHDWHWNEIARREAYDRLEEFFSIQGIRFLKPIDGQAIQL